MKRKVGQKSSSTLEKPPQKKTMINRIVDWVMPTIFIGSIFFTVYGIELYRNTFISLKPLSVAILVGFIIFFLLFYLIFGNRLSSFTMFSYALVIGSGIFYFSFLFLNIHLGLPQKNTIELTINRTGNLAKGRRGACRSPYAEVLYYGLEKQLVFPCRFENSIHDYKKIKIEVSEGFFGYKYIHSKEFLPTSQW